MKQNIFYLFFIIAILSVSCNESNKEYRFVMNGENISLGLKQYSDSLYSITLSKNDSIHSEWKLEYPVYNIDFGDVDNDGRPEVVVGTIKETRFDPKKDKRLFIFRITDDYYIRPLWLGSRVSQPLVNFRIKKENSISLIQTIEKEIDGTYLIGEYQWRGFGLQFVKHIKRNITINEAEQILNN